LKTHGSGGQVVSQEENYENAGRVQIDKDGV
jgi:hypothetical protein